MANDFITPSIIARLGLATLYNQIVLAGLLWRDFDPDFRGKQGAAITVRKPAVFEMNTFNRSTGIDIQDADEDSVTVTLDSIADVSFAVTAEELTLELDDFRERLLVPAMEAIAQGLDGVLAEAVVDAAEGVGGGGTITQGSEQPNWVFREARARLSRAKAPFTDRYGVLSPETAAECLGDELFVRVDQSGAPLALREGQVGRVFGFDTYETQQLGYGAGDKGQADGVAFHRHAVVLATRALETPMGVDTTQVAVESYKGLTLRVVKDYDINYKQDIVSVDFLYGVETLRPEFAIQLNFGHGS
jgi:hypothetical protein